MQKAQAISEAKLAAKVGTVMDVIVDDVDEDGIATCRTKGRRAKKIDGNLFIDEGGEALKPAISLPSRWTRPGSMTFGGS